MSKQNAKAPQPLSLHPLTTDQDLAAALRIKPADLKALEAKEKAERAEKRKKR